MSAIDNDAPLMDTYFVNRMFRFAADLSMVVFFLLLVLVYLICPRDELEYLVDSERTAAVVAFVVSVLSTGAAVLTFMVWQRETGKISGIVYAGLMVMIMSALANGILAFAPTYVVVDHITKSRVFLVRWCEWIPCAGLMTFLCDAVHVPKSKVALREAILVSTSQSVSCIFGLVAPFLPGLMSWCSGLLCSFILFFPIFPRLMEKYAMCLRTPKGTSFAEIERYNRHRFSYQLLLVCAVLWVFLVVIYFLNAYVHAFSPHDHFLRPYPLAMYSDVIFDVLAKSLYMRQIVDAHKLVFHSEGLAQRQLIELRRLMSALWESSSDMIILSVRHELKCLTLFSPGFSELLSGSPYDRVQKALVLEIQLEATTFEEAFDDSGIIVLVQEDDLSLIKEAYFIDSTEFSFDTLQQAQTRHAIDPRSTEARIAYRLMRETWSTLQSPETKVNKLIPCDFDRADGTMCHCEMKVLPHDENGMIAVVRDVTERVRRFEAERKAESEALKRQKEAQSQTRFVRHEIKNGLLAGIELIDNVRNALNEFERTAGTIFTGEHRLQLPAVGTDSDPGESSSSSAGETRIVVASAKDEVAPVRMHGDLTNARKHLRELDINLHEVLDTVLAEAMAREVVSEVYRPRYERTDVLNLLASDRPSRDRFPVRAKQIDFPFLQLDPQLLRYIHRNAVSNACKYGEQGGLVITLVSYDLETKDFVLEVINSPGQGHEMLRSLGPEGCEAVFAQGEMLHKSLQINSRFISSGDGAWIAQKCATAMDGSCSIRFDEDLTVFTFKCRSEPLPLVEKPDTDGFEVPPGTIAIGIDDSKIQRRLMSRIFDLLGVEEKNKIIVGENPSDVFELEKIVLNVLEKRPDCKILLFVDENLDYGGQGKEVVVMSGSRVMKDILTALPAAHERRLLALVRSANDATSDLALYMARAHGFFPKAPLNKARVRALLAPLWSDRFQPRRQSGDAEDEDVQMLSTDEDVPTDDNDDEILNKKRPAEDRTKNAAVNPDNHSGRIPASTAKRRKVGWSFGSDDNIENPAGEEVAVVVVASTLTNRMGDDST